MLVQWLVVEFVLFPEPCEVTSSISFKPCVSFLRCLYAGVVAGTKETSMLGSVLLVWASKMASACFSTHRESNARCSSTSSSGAHPEESLHGDMKRRVRR